MPPNLHLLEEVKTPSNEATTDDRFPILFCSRYESVYRSGAEENNNNGDQIHEKRSKLRWQMGGATALDTRCSLNVAGKKWLEIFIEELEDKEKAKVKGPETSILATVEN